MTDPRNTIPRPGDDEPLEEWLAELAAGYNRPPETPREAMWARIQAARGLAAPVGEVAPVAAAADAPEQATDARTDDLARRRAARGIGPSRRRWLAPLAALAATLLFGVALGRWSSATPEGAAGTVAAAAGPAMVPGAIQPGVLGPAVVMPPPVDPAGLDAAGGDEAPRPASGTPSGPAVGARSAMQPERVYAVATAPATDAASDAAPAATPDGTLSAAGSGSYRYATIQHLGQAEALLTAFRAEPPREGEAPALDPWARDLLTTTRLLLDSPAAADPRLGPLLGDLETVLVQIVQLPAARAAGERQIIAQSLDQGDLLTQLRSAVPAGPAVPQRSGE